jgi:hypothetical protein
VAKPAVSSPRRAPRTVRVDLAAPAPSRALVQRPGAAESALAVVGRRTDATLERIESLARSGRRAAESGIESARQSASDAYDRAKETWDQLDSKKRAGVVGGLAALAVAVAAPLVKSGRKRKR